MKSTNVTHSSVDTGEIKFIDQENASHNSNFLTILKERNEESENVSPRKKTKFLGTSDSTTLSSRLAKLPALKDRHIKSHTTMKTMTTRHDKVKVN